MTHNGVKAEQIDTVGEFRFGDMKLVRAACNVFFTGRGLTPETVWGRMRLPKDQRKIKK